MKRVVIVGGGIIGFSSALNIVQNLSNVCVTLITEKCSPETTSDVAAGIICPYLCGEIAAEKLNKWIKDSTNHFLTLLNSTIASEVGVNLISGYSLLEKNSKINEKMFEALIHSRKMSKEELKLFSKTEEMCDGYFQTTLTVEASKILPYYQKLFIEKGGIMRQQKVHKLEHLVDEFDVIINCTGIGAHQLVPDSSVHPIRGQIIRVNAPWIKHFIIWSSYYIIPNTDFVILGGTAQKDDWNLKIDENDRNDIKKGCEALVPSLCNAKVVSEHVGLRPGRSAPRVEREVKTFGNKKCHIIHNYGHGGSGVTLSWGCAQETLHLLKECFN